MSGNRLKRKLGELGVDVSSRKANESFCLIGTPLPPLEKSKDTGEFVPLWKQEVRDEKGRRRLHGAFTGGFSAGYYNTVGSKEGWTPSTFVSSRGDRAKQKAALPEDFMDEEDLQDLKDSRTLIDTTEEMDLTAGSKSSLEETDSLAAALEASILPPPSDSAGARILKKMGWRLGQGIGPRLTLRQKQLQDMESGDKSSSDLNIPEDDEEASKHTYSRRDTKILLIERKDNSHGLGYDPGMGLNQSLGVKENEGHSKDPRISAGFGLGALNEADDDDLDVYDGGLSTYKRRVAYDHIQDDDSNVISSRGRKGGKQNIRSATVAAFFRNGQPVLKGFVLSKGPVTEDRWFPLPDIPNGWKPDPRRVWDKTQNKENTPAPSVSTAWDAKISADERGTMLGETPLPSAPRSVFDFISKKDRERLQNVTAGLPAQPPPTPSAPSTIKIPHTEPHVAQAALRGFQPFSSDLAKQERYNVYLRSQLDTDAAGPPLTPSPGQRIDEFNKEVEDYAKAALLFKPISGAMAGRFTSAAVVEHGPKIHEGLHTPSQEDLKAKEEERRKEEEAKISPKAHAAKMGMYGPLTRETQPWQPARLLCKRFGVKDPAPAAEAPAQDGTSGSKPSWETEETAESTSAPPGAGAGSMVSSGGGPKDLANIGLGEDDDQGRDTLTYERPTMDVFKAIFASDEEDSDEEVAENEEEPPAEPQSDAAPNGMRDPPPPLEPEVVDLNTFKPTFIPREGKARKDKDKAEDKKEKKKKDKRGVLSFAMDEEGVDELLVRPSKDRPKKKKRKHKQEDNAAGDDDAIWVEKPAPDVVKDLKVPVPPPPEPLEPPAVSEPPRGRKRAVDFM